MHYAFVSQSSCNMCHSANRKVLGRRLNGSQGLRPRKRIGISTTVVKCSDCGLIYCDPLPIPETVEQHYGVPPEEYWLDEQLKAKPNHFHVEFDRLSALVPDAKTFLDVGCGMGMTLNAALKKGFDAYGVEGSASFFERNEHKDRIVNKPFEEVEFPSDSFDVVSFGVVLEHLFDPSEAIEKALTWLTPNGVIHIEVPDANFLFSKVFNLYFRLRMTDFVVNLSPMHAPFHLYEFTDESFHANGKRLGYEVAHIDRYSGDTNCLPRLSEKLEPLMRWTKTGVGLIVYLRRLSARQTTALDRDATI